jgi:hypothetical protein
MAISVKVRNENNSLSQKVFKKVCKCENKFLRLFNNSRFRLQTGNLPTTNTKTSF